jgi:hypothetical protein
MAESGNREFVHARPTTCPRDHAKHEHTDAWIGAQTNCDVSPGHSNVRGIGAVVESNGVAPGPHRVQPNVVRVIRHDRLRTLRQFLPRKSRKRLSASLADWYR